MEQQKIKPRVGDIVYFYDDDLKTPSAGIITSCFPENLDGLTAHIRVFDNHKYRGDGGGDRDTAWIPYSAEPKPGHWSWREERIKS